MLDLLDYRRRVSELYSKLRTDGIDAGAHAYWRGVRDDLFANHSQSALDGTQKRNFKGLEYYDYDPAYHVIAEIDTGVQPETREGSIGDDGILRYQRIGRVSFSLPTGDGALSIYWILGYGGGLFLPFRDATNGDTTYGGGRYLFDTIKGADLGTSASTIVLDFNFAYHPSCAYHHRWVCPLAPPENQMQIPVFAGEKLLKL